jgi:hypothetical protein
MGYRSVFKARFDIVDGNGNPPQLMSQLPEGKVFPIIDQIPSISTYSNEKN